MARKPQLSKEKRIEIQVLKKEGYSTRQIAQKVKVSQSGVAKALKRYEETGSHEDRFCSGRSRVTSKAEDKFIRVTSLRNRQKTAPEIRAQLNSTRSNNVSVETVRRRLRESGLKARVAARKPLL
ncbi:helix-turn-helix domain-containing protein, partial [Vibrio parahaemolyticus]|nr:helix-turn-helix domain-containing protein [Vibrio parahaemolyticus]